MVGRIVMFWVGIVVVVAGVASLSTSAALIVAGLLIVLWSTFYRPDAGGES